MRNSINHKKIQKNVILNCCLRIKTESYCTIFYLSDQFILPKTLVRLEQETSVNLLIIHTTRLTGRVLKKTDNVCRVGVIATYSQTY